MAPILANLKKMGHRPAETVVATAVALTITGFNLSHVTMVKESRNCISDATSASIPPATRTSNGLTPAALRPRAMSATAASHLLLIADRPSFHKACTITAITTGLTPYRRPATAGSLPYRTYAQARIPTIKAAGRMKQL